MSKRYKPMKQENRRKVERIAVQKGRHKHGKYIVNSGPGSATTITEWIISGAFEAFEQEQSLFGHRNRPRNQVYSFYLPQIERHVVMKVFHINPKYTWSRKINLFFNQYFRDYNKAAFIGCCALREAGFAVAKPLAWWNLRRDFLDPKSYFLYEKIELEHSLQDLFNHIRRQNGDASRLLDAIRRKAIDALKKIHDADLGHDDFHMRNILVNTHLNQLELKDIEEATFYFIDYDRCYKTNIRIPLIKKFFDIRDFRRVAIVETDSHEMLDLYMGRRIPVWHGVLEFWKRGGFNPLRWVKSNRPRKQRRHLRE